ncbi:DUF1343 domain-containing protein [soil metagenome]
MKIVSVIAVLLLFALGSVAQSTQPLLLGAERMMEYVPGIMGKSVGLVVNHTSVVGNKPTHLVDTLLAKRVKITKVFAPEHGFRGTADAGQEIKTETDPITGLPVVSLYGATKKPTPEQLKGLDVVVFDIQDVGVRFFTYISTMHYVMEACAEQGIPVIILDRPNPNGFYVDGPIMEEKYKSFVGMHPIPVVHGLTVGELAQMINKEKWLANGVQCKLTVIPCSGYTHDMLYQLPIKPSPNLPNMASVYLYPSVCFFEGTMMSLGRGTDKPFQIYGHPEFLIGDYEFTPTAMPGAKDPPLKNQKCHGFELQEFDQDYFLRTHQLDFQWLNKSYQYFKAQGKSDKFFTAFFEKLSGTSKLREMIVNEYSSSEIHEQWRVDLAKYMLMRQKYLLYPDFTN